MSAVKSITTFARFALAIALVSAAPVSGVHAASATHVVAPRTTPAAMSGAVVTYRKVFKTSFPEFVEIKVDQSGAGTWDIRQLDEDASPQQFQISAALAQRIFALAGNLHNFQGADLDVHRRLANLGEKTFTYANGSETHSTTFNYTLDASATQLMNIFEGLARQTTDLSDLTRTMRYDHLGVNDVMKQIEEDYNTKQLPEPELLLPALDQLAGDEKYVDIARQRARNLASKIRAGQS
jgi:hypothetical protein